MINTKFPIRKDKYGLRYIFFLGNEGGNCKYQCSFCEIGKSNAVSSEYNIKLFDNLYSDYLASTADKKNHPLIYNRGNITDEQAFSRKTLSHILNKLIDSPNLTHISLNSREKEVSFNLLNFIQRMKLSYPIHFILGQESFSESTYQIIGKKSKGEFERLNNKISQYNAENPSTACKKYNFGIDVNLLFLPELYIDQTNRNINSGDIRKGLLYDVEQVLENASELVPITINIHPYYKVKPLPYENANINMLIDILPEIKCLVQNYNTVRRKKTSVFIGFRGMKSANQDNNLETDRWTQILDIFNANNDLK